MRRRKGDKLVEEICKITQSKLNCQRLEYEIHFILCSCKIESSERKKIARKHRYGSFEYCKMEPLKKKPLVTRRKENRQIGYRFCIEQYKNICCVCNRLLYKRSVHIFGKSKYSCQNFLSVQSSFDGKQSVCKTCHLIQRFSINTSVPLLTEFDSITNIQ